MLFRQVVLSAENYLQDLGGIKPINVGLVSYAINGVGGSAKRWVQALETVTSRPDLRYLTLLPFERLFLNPSYSAPFGRGVRRATS